jgi:hypothetical protein
VSAFCPRWSPCSSCLDHEHGYDRTRGRRRDLSLRSGSLCLRAGGAAALADRPVSHPPDAAGAGTSCCCCCCCGGGCCGGCCGCGCNCCCSSSASGSATSSRSVSPRLSRVLAQSCKVGVAGRRWANRPTGQQANRPTGQQANRPTGQQASAGAERTHLNPPKPRGQ